MLSSYVQCAKLVSGIHELRNDEVETVMKQVKNPKKEWYLEKHFAMKAFQSVYVEVCTVGPIHYNNLTFIDKNKIDLSEPVKNYILVNLNCILYRWTHIVLALITLSDVILVSGLNKEFGIPDKAFIIGASALGDSINQFK